MTARRTLLAMAVLPVKCSPIQLYIITLPLAYQLPDWREVQEAISVG